MKSKQGDARSHHTAMNLTAMDIVVVDLAVEEITSGLDPVVVDRSA